MAKTAVIGLTDHIESIRREAYNEGYAAALRAVVEFSSSRTAKPKATVTKATGAKAIATKAAATKAAAAKATAAKATAAKATAAKATAANATAAKSTAAKSTTAKSTTATTATPKRQKRAQAKPAPRRTRRGDNARRIAQAMMTLPGHSGPAAAIKKTLAEKGHDLPYTSIRHGLGQLQARGEASVAADGKTWIYTAPAS
jgi:hypothetical protein